MAEAPIIRIVADAVYDRCHTLDGLRDGLIDDPRNCDFDLAKHLPPCSVPATWRSCDLLSETAAELRDGVARPKGH